MRALEERLPGVERPLRSYFPPGELPSKQVGQGTLVGRVAALEGAMDAVLRAQESALDAQQAALADGGGQGGRSGSCCACCTIM